MAYLMMRYSLAVIYDMPSLTSSTIINVAFEIVQCVINSSYTGGHPSCLLLLHVNTFHGMFVMLNFEVFVLSKKITQ